LITNFLDTLLRPDRASIPELVNILRDIHQGASAHPPPLPAMPTPGDAPQPGLSSLLARSIAAGLTRGSEGLAGRLQPSAAVAGFDDPVARRYAALQGQFDRMEREVRQHGVAVDRLVSGNTKGAATPVGAIAYQETLYLQCQRRGRTGGRFRCVNRRGQRTSVVSTLRPFTMNGAPAAAPILTVRPGSFALDAGASAIVSVEVDLESCVELADGTLQTSIDLHMNEAVAFKIWIEIELYD
jgi:hypothetical protein